MEIFRRLDVVGVLSFRCRICVWLHNVERKQHHFCHTTNGKLLLFRHIYDTQCGGVGQFKIVAGGKVPELLVYWIYTGIGGSIYCDVRVL